MKKNNQSSWTNKVIMVFFLLISPISATYAACCAGHGGVASCNKITGYKMCKDGSASPSCTCPKVTAKKARNTVTKSKNNSLKGKTTKIVPTSRSTPSKNNWWNGKTTTTTPNSSTMPPKGNWWNGKSTTTTPVNSSKGWGTSNSNTRQGTGAQGCCSRHGGVAQCNRATHHQICRDGTQSPSCMCE